MDENIKQMVRRHEKEITELQKKCPHKKISDWIDFMWAPGHFAGQVKVCEFCGKKIEHSEVSLPNIEWKTSTPNTEHKIYIDPMEKARLERIDLEQRRLGE